MIPLDTSDSGTGTNIDTRTIDTTSNGSSVLPPDTLPTIIPVTLTDGTSTDSVGAVLNSQGNVFLPTVVLETPFVDPAFTFRAATVNDMFTFVMNLQSVDVTYDIGRSPTTIPISCSLRNNTSNTDLQLDFTVPNFIQPSLQSPVLISRDTTINFFFSINEAGSNSRISPLATFFEEDISIVVTPLNVTGPVFVRTNLAQLNIQ